MVELDYYKSQAIFQIHYDLIYEFTKIAKANIGKVVSEETRKKISESLKKRNEIIKLKNNGVLFYE